MRSDFKDIFIIGSGAIGKALAVFLSLAGRKVTLIRGSVDNNSRTIENIEVITEDGTVQNTRIEIRTLDTFHSLDGIIVLANKSYGNEHLANALKNKIGSSPVVLLQNGLGVEQPFIDKNFPEIYRCVLFMTSQLIDTSTVRFKPVAPCPIGIIRGNDNTLRYIVEHLHVPAFQFRNEPDIQPVIWKKTIINSVYNSICPLLDTDNGIFHRDTGALEIARRIMAEGIAIAGEKGIMLQAKEVEENLLHISRFSDGQLISTLQDLRNNRRTEIDTLNFAIVRAAQSLQKEDIVREIQLLGELIKLKEEMALMNRGHEEIQTVP